MYGRFEHQHTDMHNLAALLILGLSCLLIGGLVVYGPISQVPSYHDFADQRTLFSVPNFWNVVSNIPFILVGILGLHRCKAMQNCLVSEESRVILTLFFTGVLFTGMSSAYFHLQPDNGSLFWDRLSMALSFMAFFSLVIGEFISSKFGRQLVVPLVFFGLISVVYWNVTEQSGAGDLRLYAITQFLPILIIPIIVFFWKSESILTSDIAIIGVGYGCAKLLELFDAQTFQLAAVSGHSLKHLAAAFSTYWVLILSGREPQKINRI